ncbi:MAG TPA: helix-turn-helix transcriptional regulator [Bacillota bacterium]
MAENYKFGLYLKNLRTQNNLTLKDLDRASGVSFGSISRMEDAKQDPNPDMLRKLAPALGVPYEEMLVMAGILDPKEETNKETNFPEDIQEIIRIANKLNHEQRQKLISIAKTVFPEVLN